MLAFKIKDVPDADFYECRGITAARFTDKYGIGGLVKGAAMSNCHNLKLIVMEGERTTIHEGEETIEVIPASDWLCIQERYK